MLDHPVSVLFPIRVHAFRILLLIIVAAFLAGPVARAEGDAAGDPDALEDPADRLEVHQLENGLTLLTVEDHSTPVVSVQVWVNAGSSDESFYTGVAHLFEHMMFRGSKNIGPEEHARLIGARGGQLNAYTSRDVTVYYEDVTSESLPLVIDLEAERFANLDISPETLESEREVVLEERRLRTEDNPNGVAFEALAALTWMAHPYRWPVIGWRSDVEEVTVDVCRTFFDTYYAANNLTLVIVGDFDTAEARARVERAFGPLRPSPSIPRNPTRVVRQRGERRAEVEFDVRVPLLYAAYHAPPSGHPDAEALDVASQILSAGRSSRLYQSLVDRNALAIYAQGGYMEYQDAGMFYGVAGARPGVPLAEVEKAFFAEVDRMAAEGVSEAEVAKAKRQLEVSLVNGLGTNHSLADRVGQEWIYFGRVRPLSERLEAYRRVTPEDVQRVVAKYLVEEKRSVVHVVPPKPEQADAASSEEGS